MPKALRGPGPEGPASDPKTQKLCALVHRTLELTLAGEISDESLATLEIIEVLPHPGQRRLLVVLRCEQDGGEALAPISLGLRAIRGLLRTRLAEALQRKRTPELEFALLPSDARPIEEIPQQ